MKAVRESLSAPPEDWELLEEIQRQGLAKGRSGAFQFLCDEYRRHQAEQGFLETARRINPDELAELAGTTPPPATPPASWSALVTED